jgi:hypothetical protein
MPPVQGSSNQNTASSASGSGSSTGGSRSTTADINTTTDVVTYTFNNPDGTISTTCQSVYQDQCAEIGGGVRIGCNPIVFLLAELDTVGLLVQDIQIVTQKPISTIYDLTTKFVYYVAGRASAQITMQKTVGPKGIAMAYLRQLGNVCLVKENIAHFVFNGRFCSNVDKGELLEPDNGTASIVAGNEFSNTIKVDACLSNTVSFSVNVRDYLINEGVQIQGQTVCLDNVGGGDAPDSAGSSYQNYLGQV